MTKKIQKMHAKGQEDRNCSLANRYKPSPTPCLLFQCVPEQLAPSLNSLNNTSTDHIIRFSIIGCYIYYNIGDKIYSASWSTFTLCPCPHLRVFWLKNKLAMQTKQLFVLPCSLLLSPLCDVCPPLDGPGVPPERVDAVSSWSLFQDVWQGGREQTSWSVNLMSPSWSFLLSLDLFLRIHIFMSCFETFCLHRYTPH